MGLFRELEARRVVVLGVGLRSLDLDSWIIDSAGQLGLDVRGGGAAQGCEEEALRSLQ